MSEIAKKTPYRRAVEHFRAIKQIVKLSFVFNVNKQQSHRNCCANDAH
jgi:hypothetical protein